jgi:outer membrane protein assembly factor BamB
VVQAVALASLASLALTACAHREEPRRACRTDVDCKLDRICEENRCVWPGPRGLEAKARQEPAPTGAPSVAAREVVAGGAATPAVAAQAMFRLDPSHRGRSPHRLPAARPVIAWTYEARGPIASSPARSAEGWIAVGSHDGRLHVVGPDGAPLWAFATGDIIFSTPAIAPGGALYVGSDDDHLYALDVRERRTLWRFRVGSCRNVGIGPEASRCDADAGPTIGPDGTIYTGGDGIHAIRPDGSLRWRFPTAGHVSSAPALLPDGTVVAGCQDNAVYAVNPDGSKRWDFRAKGDVESSPAVAEDGTVYVGSDDGRLYALTRDGVLRWAFTAGDDVRASPAIGPDGTIYVGAFDGLFYAVRPEGTLKWTFRAGDRILSSALVDAEGAVLFGSQDDRLYALEANGFPRWSVELGGDVDSSPLLAADGTIYVGADDKKLYALRPQPNPKGRE